MRGMSSCREALYIGFLEKHIIRTPRVRSPARRRPICFFATEYSQILSRQGGGVCETFFGGRGYGLISGGTRVLELAAGSREAAPEQGAR
jgi:uncharacterized Fe-S cluster-containing protein